MGSQNLIFDRDGTARLALTASYNPASYNPRMHNAGLQKSLRTPMPPAPRFAAVCAFVLLCCLGALAAKEFVMPAAESARPYPAHDEHPTEKVVVAVDPYDVEDKASIFSVNYRNYGYMPVFFVTVSYTHLRAHETRHDL